ADMPQRWRLEFGPKNSVRAFPILPGPGGTSVLDRATIGTGGAAGAGSLGVYIASRDYLCITLDESYAFREGYSENPTTGRLERAPTGPVTPTTPSMRRDERGPFVLILRRQSVAPAPQIGRASCRDR